MKYTIHWGYANGYERSAEYDSGNPDLCQSFAGKKESIEDMVVSDFSEIIDSGAVWCKVYKNGELVNEYDMYDEFQRQEVEHEF